MFRRWMLPRAAVGGLVWALASAGAWAQPILVPPTMGRAELGALGAEAELACRTRPEATCLASLLLARLAAGAGERGEDRIGDVLNTLAGNGHAAVVRDLLPMAASVAEASGDPQADRVLRRAGILTFTRGRLVPEARSAAGFISAPMRRAQARLILLAAAPSAETLAEARAALPGFEDEGRAGQPAEEDVRRATATDWLDVLEAALADDASRVGTLLEALARSPRWPDSFNADPSEPSGESPPSRTMQMYVGGGSSFDAALEMPPGSVVFRGDVGWMRITAPGGRGYDGMRNLPRLAAYAALAMGDPEAAITAAREIRYPLARVSVLTEIRRRFPVVQGEIDAMLVAIGEARPDDPALRDVAFGALIRLDRLDAAERQLRKETEAGARVWEPGGSAPWRALIARHARAGTARRVPVLVEAALAAAAKALEAESGMARADRQAQLERARARLQLTAFLSTPGAERPAATLLARHAAAYDIEACAAGRRPACFALDLTLQAIADAPRTPAARP